MFFWRVYEFYFDFCWISGKMDEIRKFRQFRGPTPRRKDSTQQRKSTPRRGLEGGLDKPRVRRGIAKLRSSKGLSYSVALFTDM